MSRPPIDYLNARRALKPASGGTNYRASERAIYAPDDMQSYGCGLTPDEYERRFKKAEEDRARTAAQKRKLIAERQRP